LLKISTFRNEMLFGSSSEIPELTLLNLKSFAYRKFSNKELESAQWPDTTQVRIREGAMHSGLIILSTDKYEFEMMRRRHILKHARNRLASANSDPAVKNAKLAIRNAQLEMEDDKLASYRGVPHLCSFSVKGDLRLEPSPILPEGFYVHSISINDKYIYIGGMSRDTGLPWEIRIWERGNLGELAKLTGPTLFKDLEVPDEWIQHVVTRENLIIAVTPLGRLFYWDNFTALPDRSVTLTDHVMYSERYIDTVYLNESLDRVVVMHLMSGTDVAMVLDNKLSLVPAYALTKESTGNVMDYYLRIDTECQTAIRVRKPEGQEQPKTPQLDIYNLPQSEPWFRVPPLSVSLNVDLGAFIDVWVNKYSLTYFGANGAVQLRFDQENEADRSHETSTSSQYVAFRSLETVRAALSV
jgi:hypothetical protein